jgi:hypothetical protein
MKKLTTGLWAVLVAGSLLFFNCGGTNTAEHTDEEHAEMEETAATETRPSPLRTLDGTINGKKVAVQYGAPSVKGRTIWGDLVPYNEVWRTGANESTFVDFEQDMEVEGQTLAAGKYSLFTIPKAGGNWTVIFKSEWDLEHGHFQYKQENDVLRVESAPVMEGESQEQLTIAIESPGIVVRWEKMKLPIAIQ